MINLEESHLKLATTLAASLLLAALPAAAQQPPAAGGCAPPPKELVMRDLAEGSGKTIVFRSGALVWYTGWLYDGCKPDFKGQKFDSNVGGKVPFSLLVGTGKVIKGWDEGLIGMKEKGKRLLIIPADKAYGAREVGGGLIPANSALVFEVEVVQVPFHPDDTPPKAR